MAVTLVLLAVSGFSHCVGEEARFLSGAPWVRDPGEEHHVRHVRHFGNVRGLLGVDPGNLRRSRREKFDLHPRQVQHDRRVDGWSRRGSGRNAGVTCTFHCTGRRWDSLRNAGFIDPRSWPGSTCATFARIFLERVRAGVRVRGLIVVPGDL